MKKLNDTIETILSKFPDNATTWRNATDEIRDLAYKVRSTYNELTLDVVEGDAGYVESLDFRTFKTPGQWNKEAKKQIRTLVSKMNDWSKKNLLEDL